MYDKKNISRGFLSSLLQKKAILECQSASMDVHKDYLILFDHRYCQSNTIPLLHDLNYKLNRITTIDDSHMHTHIHTILIRYKKKKR